MNQLFVYGTLMPGDVRWQFLAPYVVGEPVAATVRGALYDTGHGYPALFPDGDRDVPGVLVALDQKRLDEALAVLDEVEGLVEGLYRRELADVGGQPAWTYYGGDDALRARLIDRWAPPRP